MRGLPQEAVLADMVRDVSRVNVSTCARAHCSCTVCTPMACMAHSPGSVAARLSSCVMLTAVPSAPYKCLSCLGTHEFCTLTSVWGARALHERFPVMCLRRKGPSTSASLCGSGLRVCSHLRACRSAERAHARAAGVPGGRDGPPCNGLQRRLLLGRRPTPPRRRRPGRPGDLPYPTLTLPYPTPQHHLAAAGGRSGGQARGRLSNPRMIPSQALARSSAALACLWHLQSLLHHALSFHDSPELLCLARPSWMEALHSLSETRQRGQRGRA